MEAMSGTARCWTKWKEPITCPRDGRVPGRHGVCISPTSLVQSCAFSRDTSHASTVHTQHSRDSSNNTKAKLKHTKHCLGAGPILSEPLHGPQIIIMQVRWAKGQQAPRLHYRTLLIPTHTVCTR